MEVELRDEEKLLEKIRELPLIYKKELMDFIEYLQLKAQRKETLYLSEQSLSKDWLLPEEDEAWKNL
ncbi:Protein of unknown function [Desulfonauticus submarinus]|uniref:Uncharacterized protein n=2 Tax=Desulfonauticus submarinus TaxID=206665 RepID=A0A1H0AMP3_9BACT|nr:DUF2281 domain-containing protein [Desulfonauticus submarinus]SDN34800.1 Protein of unknown function [Desulfonauticus submarinus]SDN81049.1 Protein of unknown function [Desulfonauticus submarinus]SDN90022.1 Protein of unknown function [Desulfonauticus submarinus]